MGRVFFDIVIVYRKIPSLPLFFRVPRELSSNIDLDSVPKDKNFGIKEKQSIRDIDTEHYVSLTLNQNTHPLVVVFLKQ